MKIEAWQNAKGLARLDDQLRSAEGWSQQTFERLLADDGYRILGVGEKGVLLAFAVFSMGPFDAELEMIGVEEGHRRRGLASALMDAMIEEGSRAGLERVLLEVRAGNASALALYARHGFSMDGRRPGYYPGAAGQREDAILMSRPLAR